LNTYQDVRAVRSHGRNRPNLAEQENAIGAWIGNTRKLLQPLSNIFDTTPQGVADIPANSFSTRSAIC
jgi:hypothetical protein